MAPASLLEFSPTGCPYSLSIILILGMSGVLENISSNLLIPLPFFFCGSRSVNISFKQMET
jgi:hypothetical protein